MALIGKTVYNKTGETVLFEGSYNPMSAIAQDLLDDLISYGVTEISETIGGPSIDHEAGIDAFDDIVYDVTPEPAPVYPETIAGQISRLQDAKACIKAAIEEKGVTIGSDVTLDGYACCINNIQQGGGGYVVDFLIVGGGGGGGTIQGGGGGGGGVIYCSNYLLENNNYSIVVGSGGGVASNGGNSSAFGLTAYGGGKGGNQSGAGSNGGSGGGSGINRGGTTNGGNPCYTCGITAQGSTGGLIKSYCNTSGVYSGGGGGGGAGGTGGHSGAWIGAGSGGPGIQSDISGANTYYGAGGGGSGYCTNGGAGGTGGGGAGGCTSSSTKNGCNASGYGGGGGGTCGRGYQGIVIVRHKTECGYSITGGTCYTCGDYTIHCFTSSGTLCITG